MPAGGRLTTHVLDVSRGRPAEGVPITLHALAGNGERKLLAEAVTNADGRTGAPLLAAGGLHAGVYELTFAVGAYLGATAAPVGAVPFLDVVPVRFGIAEPDRDHHVPLLLTPWSYSVYRGS